MASSTARWRSRMLVCWPPLASRARTALVCCWDNSRPLAPSRRAGGALDTVPGSIVGSVLHPASATHAAKAATIPGVEFTPIPRIRFDAKDYGSSAESSVRCRTLPQRVSCATGSNVLRHRKARTIDLACTFDNGRNRDGCRYRQVVQRREGFRIHHPGRWRQGSLCPSFGNPGNGLQVPQGRPEGGVRGDARRQGPRRFQDPACLMAEIAKIVTGVVRSFNDAKGFGLITPDLGGPPIFVHQSAIRTPGVKKLKRTQRVEYEVEIRPEGPAASNLRMLA